jgi:UDP-N-acetylmuramate--alanine ligase
VELDKVKHIVFIGIGGIGMSAIARYFKFKGKHVSGYDKTETELTRRLALEGMDVHYCDTGEKALIGFSPADTLVVYTPAIPADFGELNAFRNAGFVVLKRSEILGLITEHTKGIGVAGTHGKTTTSTMLAHVLHQTVGCSAFLGGISSNYETNLLVHATSPLCVMEADEFDRSFLKLSPYAGVLTAVDPDHLDIYGDVSGILEGFSLYINRIDENGFLLIHESIEMASKCRQIRYGLHEGAAIRGLNLRAETGRFLMDVSVDSGLWEAVELGIPGIHNAENALAVIGVALELGLSEPQIREGLRTFKGVKRRFEYRIRKPEKVYIDDYAHHPTEINALLNSVRLMYPGKRVMGIFQPHLFSRTRDFMEGFAESLSKVDELIVLPIYPARELPIEGITSEALMEQVALSNKLVCQPEEAISRALQSDCEVILTIGAGDIDRIVEPLTAGLS